MFTMRSRRRGIFATINDFGLAGWAVVAGIAVVVCAFVYQVWVDTAHPLNHQQVAQITVRNYDEGNDCGIFSSTDCVESDPSWTLEVTQSGWSHTVTVSKAVYEACSGRSQFVNGACPRPGSR